MAYLFVPPVRDQVDIMHGRNLKSVYPVCQAVWKDADGVWQHSEVPAQDSLTGAQFVILGRPQVVPNEIASELIAAGIGNCIPIGS